MTKEGVLGSGPETVSTVKQFSQNKIETTSAHFHGNTLQQRSSIQFFHAIAHLHHHHDDGTGG